MERANPLVFPGHRSVCRLCKEGLGHLCIPIAVGLAIVALHIGSYILGMKLSYNLVQSKSIFWGWLPVSFHFAVSFHFVSCLTDTLVESPHTDTLSKPDREMYSFLHNLLLGNLILKSGRVFIVLIMYSQSEVTKQETKLVL